MQHLNQKSPRTAAAIFSLNRPSYLKQVVDSLTRNTYLANIDFYLFQDGSINEFSGRAAADPMEIDACLDIWEKSSLPNKHLIRNATNQGIGITQFEAKELILETLGYHQMLIFEDDLVVNKYYLKNLLLMLDQFAHEPSVGVVMCNGSVPKTYSEEEKSLLLNKLRSGNDQLWGWATWRDRWLKVKPDFLDYYSYIRNIDYRKRPDEEIFAFYRKKGFDIRASSQDAAFYYSMIKNEMFSINTVLHRAKYIGAIGEHMNPEKYERFGWGNTDVLDTDAEAAIQRFDGFDKSTFLGIAHSIFDLKRSHSS